MNAMRLLETVALIVIGMCHQIKYSASHQSDITAEEDLGQSRGQGHFRSKELGSTVFTGEPENLPVV